MAAGNTYIPIATQTLGSSSATVTFSSISATYTDLVLIISANQTVGNNDVWLQFNSDTASNYSNTQISGNGTSAASTRASSQTKLYIDNNATMPTAASTFGNQIINIMNYSNTTTYKTVLSRSNNAAAATEAFVSLWRATPAAITTILIGLTGASNFTTGSTFSLYGIASA